LTLRASSSSLLTSAALSVLNTRLMISSMMMDMPTRPSDPLAALGASNFANILDFLPIIALAIIPAVSKAWRGHSNDHKSGVWRNACYRAGVSNAKIEAVAKARNAALQGGSEVPTMMDWKQLCKEHISEDNNWRYGRCKEDYIYNECNDVWRFKIDNEENMCMMTSTRGELKNSLSRDRVAANHT
jgi:hypothetical protein